MMDVYGFPTYQYCGNQSDELAKQMLAQQALASSMPYNRESPEPHVMPVPPGTPWNVQGVPWGLSSPPELVQFTAQNALMDPKVSPVVHCKRKSLDTQPVIPAKQLITEEKMAAHLSGLHISPDYTTHTSGDEFMDVGVEVANSAAPILEKLKGHKIVLSEEVKKLQEEPLIPASLMESLQKPHMSLVVWKPRDVILEKLKEEDKEDSRATEGEETQKRNGLLVPEYGGMDVEM